MIEGRITTRSWDDKTSGEKKYRTEIIADAVQFGPKSGGAAPQGEGFTGNPNPVTPKTSKCSRSRYHRLWRC